MAPDRTLLLPLDPRPEGKRCKRCRLIKPISEFHFRLEQNRHRAECKACYRAAVTARRDPVDNRARVKRWMEENPEKKKAAMKRSYERSRSDLVRWISKILGSTRSYCKTKTVEYSLSALDLAELFNAQGGRCALTGRAMIFGSKGVQRDSLSLDRMNQGGGYVLDNIRLVTFQANFARNRYSDAELLSLCEDILVHHGYAVTRPGAASAG